MVSSLVCNLVNSFLSMLAVDTFFGLSDHLNLGEKKFLLFSFTELILLLHFKDHANNACPSEKNWVKVKYFKVMQNFKTFCRE